MSSETWRDSRFDGSVGDQDPSGPASRVVLRCVAGALVLISFVIFMNSRTRSVFRCRQECYGAPPLERFGSVSYEPGHPWTHYADSWQWGVQHGLTQLGLVASLVALGLAATNRRNPLPAFGLTALAFAAWAVWMMLSPSIP